MLNGKVFILFCCTTFGSCRTTKNNVCRTFYDYATISTNKNCWYNPDIYSAPSTIAKRLGYPFEKHKVETDDGYILTLFRIPNNNKDLELKRQPVLIHHGIGGISLLWLMQGRDSLAFFLSDNGYDVWLANGRGTIYSSDHKWINRTDPAYWDFGFHEMGTSDIPAMAEKISNITGQNRNAIYIGHSMGSTISYVYFSTKGDHAENYFKGTISLAPVAYLSNPRGLLKILKPYLPRLEELINTFDFKVLVNYNRFQKGFTSQFCGSYPTVLICNWLEILTVGGTIDQINPETLPFFFKIFPNGISTKILRHYLQLMSNNTFSFFDYGPQENMNIYNSAEPPEYDVKLISLPVFLFIGNADFLGTVEDAEILYQKLKSPESKTKLVEKYTFDLAHNDFFHGKDLRTFHATLLDVMKTKLI